MKTYVILSSDNQVLLFTENDLVYTLSIPDEDNVILFSAKDTGDGIEFIDGGDLKDDFDYGEADYLRLFLNLIHKMDNSLFESYRVLEPVDIV